MSETCNLGGCCPTCGGSEEKPEAGPAHRREATLLIGCALVFGLALGFEGAIEARFGLAGVAAAYGLPYLVCGWSIFGAAWGQIRKGSLLNEFTLMCGATLAAIALQHLSEAVGVMLFYRTGEFFQELATDKSLKSIKNLLASKPTLATVLEGGLPVVKKVEAVAPGDLVLVKPGEKIPLDGLVISGISQVDQSPLTGESLPVTLEQGAKALGGSINLDGALTIEVESRFADTHMARILDLVQRASANKSPTERFITRFARYYTPAVFCGAALVAVLPPLITGEPFGAWIYRALVLLVISCPCALIISIPLGYFGGIGAASRRGILVKGGTVLDALLHVKTLVFDKTGTLTTGSFNLSQILPAEGIMEADLLRAAAIAESDSNHPVARAVMRAVPDFRRPAEAVISEVPGKGMRAVWDGAVYLTGTARLLRENGVEFRESQAPGSLVYVAKDSTYLGCLAAEDRLKPESAAVIAELAGRGLKSAMLTGDNAETAARIAAEAGLSDYRAGLLPEDKVKIMRELGGRETAFVGDGINDAPSLALAGVGIAMGKVGSEAAIEAADAVILNDSLASIPELFRIARKVRAVVVQNIILALGVKTAFMALGIVGLSGLWEAVFADVGVALLAVLNAVRGMRGR